MSAVKIIFKRSSLLGKRPTGQNLEAGELALNTNANDPGIFFEANDGSIAKAGPTSYLSGAPTDAPSLGELWVDRDTKALSIGTDLKTWQSVGTPFLGGTSGLTVFVAPDFPNATDSLANDGQTVPFITINRAILEVSKNIVQETLAGISTGNKRYLIVLAPGQHCVVNRPGTTVDGFNLNLTDSYQTVTQDILSAFNPDTVGGLVLPRGVSIIGLDLKKCEVRPTYVPKYTHPAFPYPYQQTSGGPVYKNQPFSSVFRWSGNTYLSNFSGLDKVDSCLVTQVKIQSNSLSAILETDRPHGLNYNDFVQINYSDSVDQANSKFTSGQYFVYPLNSFQFLISVTDWTSDTAAAIPAESFPASYFLPSAGADPKFNVYNIYPYYVPPTNESYEFHNYSHHRLSLVKNASVKQLNNFYIKVQKAFPDLFAGQVNSNLVSEPEYQIVASTSFDYPNNISSNQVDNSSPYLNMVNIRSDYGLANCDADGNLVSGFKSVIINSSTAVSLQKDPVAYELYSSSGQNWVQLTKLTQQSLGGTVPVVSVSTQSQLQTLNSTPIPNVRYYYTTLKIEDPSGSNVFKSTGVSDPDNDFRHFGFRLTGSNSYMQSQSVYTIGPAISVWAKEGGLISLTNSTTNFGSVAFQSDGFSGIGTLGGANEINKGFLLSGVVRPLRLLEESVSADEQKRILFLGSKIVRVGIDPNDPSVQLIYLQRPFDPATILPFSLKPGSAIFTSDGVCTYRAFFVTDGTSTCLLTSGPSVNPSEGGAILRVRVSDSTIPNGDPTDLDIPYIRRFIDPRTPSDKSYGFYIQSSNPTSQAPQLGSVLRLNQTGQNLSNSLKRNYQFDPGQYGGYGQVFSVDDVQTEQFSVSPNFNYKIADASQSTNYVIYTTVTDSSSPWTQVVPSDPTDLQSQLVPAYNPQGSYVVGQYRNYYASENRLWNSLYYETNFNPSNGPVSVSPEKSDSIFVTSSALEKTELVSDSWQGLVPDPYYGYYTQGVPSPYKESLSYMRGSVVPYTQYSVQYQVDDDDSSDNFGIIFKTVALPTNTTVLVAPSVTSQTGQSLTSPYSGTPTFGRPTIAQIELLSVQQIVLPKEGVSILQLTNETLTSVEYVRVISVNSSTLQVIRNYYPEYAQGTLPAQWPKGTTVKVCESSGFPEPSMYDPNWAPTKAAMFRFFQLMGYTPSLVRQYLTPRYSGERLLLNSSLNLSPINGYANLTSAWPVEFNNPSSIIANTHTWQYAGYLDYSRGLPKYQVNEISRKLSYDYLSTTSWGGRLTVTGVNESGQMVFLGPIKEAITSRFFSFDTPVSSTTNRQVYTSPISVELPNPVLVYSVDDISGLFDGSTQIFDLTRGGYSIPDGQLSQTGTFVFLGGVVQKPGDAYILQRSSIGVSSPQIIFTEAPLEGTSCDIRIVTSDDSDQTMEVVTYALSPAFDGSQSSFLVSPAETGLSNLNSFVFLGGVEQNPYGINQTSAAYFIDVTNQETSLTFIAGSPLAGTVTDVRGIISGKKYRDVGLSTVFVSSVDDISPLFNNTEKKFPLTINGEPLDPSKVNSQNMFVSLGGVMQVPVEQSGSPLAGLAYTVSLSEVTKTLEITFATPPLIGTTCNIRVITSDEFLTCPLPAGLFNTSLQVGPGVTVNENNQITDIDSGLIS